MSIALKIYSLLKLDDFLMEAVHSYWVTLNGKGAKHTLLIQ